MKFFKDFLHPILALFIICLVTSSLLMVTYSVTEPIIAQREEEDARRARSEVLAGAVDFTQIKEGVPEGVEVYEETSGLGFVFTTSAKGYSSEIKIMTGILKDGTISAVKVLSQGETPGLGARIEEKSYTDQYQGKDATLNDVEKISGASISSKAFNTAVKTAFEVFGEVAGVEVPEEEIEAAPDVEFRPEEIFADATFREVEVPGVDKAFLAEDGRCVIGVTTEGYLGPMSTLVGIDAEGKVAGIQVVSSKDSPDQMKSVTAEEYLANYLGKTNVDDVELVSGATGSSTALKKGVQKALSVLPQVKEAL